jgi:histone deacetylase 6
VYVAENHSVWSPERQRKQRKKYGQLVKSETFSLNDMLSTHRNEVLSRLLQDTADYHKPVGDVVASDVTIKRAEPNVTMSSNETLTTETADGSNTSAPVTIKNERESKSPNRLTPSPNPLRSPNRLPPVGVFTVTTPDRGI